MSTQEFPWQRLGEILRRLPKQDLDLIAQTLGARVETEDPIWNEHYNASICNIVGQLHELLRIRDAYQNIRAAVDVIRRSI